MDDNTQTAAVATQETQQSFIRGLLEFPVMVPMLAGMVQPQMFDAPKMAAVYRVILQAVEEGGTGPISQAAFYKAAQDLSLTKALGGEEEIYTIYMEVGSLGFRLTSEGALNDAATVIRTGYVRKSLAEVLYRGYKALRTTDVDPISEIAKVTDSCETLVQGMVVGNDRVTRFGDNLVERLDLYIKFRSDGRKVLGLSTGIARIDDVTMGLQLGRFYMIGGWFGSGKSSAMLQMATHIATEENQPVAVVIFESSTADLCDRWLAQQCSMNTSALRDPRAQVDGKWPLETFREMAANRETIDIHHLNRLDNLIMISAAGLTVLEVEALLHQTNRDQAKAGKPPIAAIFWDYIQITETRGSGESREREISQVGRDLLNLGMKFKVPMIALSQINAVDANYARESKALAGHCDSFWIVRISTEAVGDPRDGLKKAVFWQEKNRHAGIGFNIPVVWDGPRQRFYELTAQYGESPECFPDPANPADEHRWEAVSLPLDD